MHESWLNHVIVKQIESINVVPIWSRGTIKAIVIVIRVGGTLVHGRPRGGGDLIKRCLSEPSRNVARSRTKAIHGYEKERYLFGTFPTLAETRGKTHIIVVKAFSTLGTFDAPGRPATHNLSTSTTHAKGPRFLGFGVPGYSAPSHC